MQIATKIIVFKKVSSSFLNSRACSGLTAVYFDCRYEVLSVCVILHIFSNRPENLSEDVKTLFEACMRSLT